MLKRYLILIGFSLFFWLACQNDDDFAPLTINDINPPPTETIVYEDSIPHLPQTLFDYDGYEKPPWFINNFMNFLETIPADNPITDEGATLGRVLFYDKKLSLNNSTSCGSCHHQAYGFADTTSFSIGFEGELTSRNSMNLVNLQFSRFMFWDFSSPSLEHQVLQPISDPVEMGITHDSLLTKLAEVEYYRPLFTQAFGDSLITTDRISKALAQFVRSIVSFDTKYDEGEASNFANFNESELLGKELFVDGEFRCNNCHLPPNFMGIQPENNGLDLVYEDNGAGNGRFKAPSLRNIALTAPYMHDGRFQTLEQVVEHYNTGLQAHPFLGDQLTENFIDGDPPIQYNMTDEEKQALVDFLHTLTDPITISHEKYSNPFIVNDK